MTISDVSVSKINGSPVSKVFKCSLDQNKKTTQKPNTTTINYLYWKSGIY